MRHSNKAMLTVKRIKQIIQETWTLWSWLPGSKILGGFCILTVSQLCLPLFQREKLLSKSPISTENMMGEEKSQSGSGWRRPLGKAGRELQSLSHLGPAGGIWQVVFLKMKPRLISNITKWTWSYLTLELIFYYRLRIPVSPSYNIWRDLTRGFITWNLLWQKFFKLKEYILQEKKTLRK